MLHDKHTMTTMIMTTDIGNGHLLNHYSHTVHVYCGVRLSAVYELNFAEQ